MAGNIPLPPGGLEKAQKALDLGATPAEVERLSLGWVKVINGRAVPAPSGDELRAQAAQAAEPAEAPTAPVDVEIPETVEQAVDAETIAGQAAPEQPTPVLPEQPVNVAPAQESPPAEEPELGEIEDPAVQDYWRSISGDRSYRPIGFKEETPGPLVQLGAAIETASPTKALFDLARSPTFRPDPEFNFYDHLEDVKQSVHPDYWPVLADSQSKAELDHRLQKIADEQFAAETIFKGNKVVGGAALVASILGDPTSLVAGVAEFKLMTTLASTSRLKNAATAGAGLAATGAAQESIIAQARETYTADDVVIGTLIGAGLGAGLGAAMRPLRHADLLQETRRITDEVREQRAAHVDSDAAPSTGPGYTATDSDLPPRRFERVQEAVREDRAAVAAAIRQHVTELRQRARAAATSVKQKEGLRRAKKELSKAREELATISRAPGRVGQKAARQRVSAAEQAVDDIIQAQVASRAARAASKELAAFQRMSRDGQIKAVFGEAGAPVIARARVQETAESIAEREAAIARRQEQAEQTDAIGPEGGGSVGAARADTEETPIDLTLQQRDIIDEAEEWDAVNGAALDQRLNSKTGKAVQGLGKTGLLMDSTFFLKARSSVARHFGATILENGAGFGGREWTAALMKNNFQGNLLKKVMLPYRMSYSAWAKAQGISKFNLKQYYGSGKTKFDQLLRKELEGRRLARSTDVITRDRAVAEAADAWQRAFDDALQLMKDSGVRGADEIDALPGYVPLKWMGNKLRQLSKDSVAFDGAVNALARSYARVLDIQVEDARLMANAVVQRAMKKELQLDTNPANLLTGDARAELRSMFEEAGLHAGKMEALLRRIDNRVSDAGRSARLRRRNEVDLNERFIGRDGTEYRLMDLVDNNLDTLASRYMAEASGRAALARKGIKSEADWDTLTRTVVQDMAAKDASTSPAAVNERLQNVYSQMLGRPVGEGVNRNARRLMDLATVSLLGQVGFAQLAEFAPITATLGLRETFAQVPSMKRMLQTARRGELEPDLVDEIESISGQLGNEHLLFRPEVRLEDAAGDDQAWLQVIDKGLAAGMDMLGYASGMNHIKRLQQRLATKVIADKVARLATGRSAGRLTPERLADVGWSPEVLEPIQGAIKKHGTFDGSGRLQRLNMENWDPAVVEDFALGINRFANQVVQRPLVGETAGWMHKTLGAMFTQFRHFPIVATEKQLARNTMHQDMATFMTVTYGLMWSGVAYVARQAANAPGHEDGWLEDQLAVDRVTKGAIQYSSMAAIIPDGISVLAYAGIVPAEWAFNPGHTGGHKQSRLGLQAIPALGAAEDLFNTVTTPTRALWDDYEIGKKDVTALQGATVLGNTLPASIIFGLLKQEAE